MSADSNNAAAATHQPNQSLAAAQAAATVVAVPGPVTSHQSTGTSLLVLGAIGLVIGAIGGALKAAALHDSYAESLVSGALFGLVFGLFFSRRATSAGAGLIWGLGFSFLAWIVFPNGAVHLMFHHTTTTVFADARDRFPLLVACILCLGTPVGLVFGIWGGLHASERQPKFHVGRAIVAGGFAGVVGGALFSSWVASGDYFPLLAGYSPIALAHSTVILLHFGAAVLIGISFGFLFQRDVRGFGSCMGCGC